MNTELILVSIGITLFSLSLLICVTMILLIPLRIRQWKSNSPLLLILNTYLCYSVTNVAMLAMCYYTLRGAIDPSLVFDGPWCRCRAFFTYVTYCAAYYSFALQAIFRLFNVIFYQKKCLQTFRACIIGVVVMWVFAFLSILPNLIFDDFQYLPTEYNCWIGFQNIRGLLMCLIVIYNVPLSVIFTIYTRILLHTHKKSLISNSRKSANQRNVIVLRRIIILMFIVVGVGLPAFVVIIINFITKRILRYSNHIQGFSIAIGIFITSIGLTLITPQLKEVFPRRNALVHPQNQIVRAQKTPTLPNSLGKK